MFDYGVADEYNKLAAGPSCEVHLKAPGSEDELDFGDDEVTVGDGVASDYKVPLLSLKSIDSVHQGQ
jgi:hypothetical protein